jgi:hypothetical protein
MMCISPVLLLSACLEYNITTQVLPDGRIQRIITVRGDTALMFKGPLLLPVDSGWNIRSGFEWQNEKDTSEGKVFVYEAIKEFDNVYALNREFYKDTSFSEKISMKVSLVKKIRWFYTVYDYTETYAMLFPFRALPLGNYLNESELKIYLANDTDLYYSPAKDSILIKDGRKELPVLTGADSLRFKALKDKIEVKIEKWQKENIYEEFYRVVMEALSSPGISAERQVDKASFFQWMDSVEVMEIESEPDQSPIAATANYLGVDSLGLRKANESGFDLFNRKFRVACYAFGSYINQVLMPGMILVTNADATRGNLAIWKFEVRRFYVSDFMMHVRSRTVNKWFIVAAGLVLVALVMILSCRLYREKRQ